MIATLQEHYCYKRGLSAFANAATMAGSDKELIDALVEWSGQSITAIARKAGLAVTTLTRPANIGVSHRLSLPTMEKLKAAYPEFPEFGGRGRTPAADDEIPMVGIRTTDADFGLGAIFTDSPTDIQVVQFPKAWVEALTYAPPELLSWARARGDSMAPTIGDGDMVLIDHSDRRVEDQDLIWAFTVGDTRAIKRLRKKGSRFVIISDGDVPPDEEPIDVVNIVGRVIRVVKRT